MGPWSRSLSRISVNISTWYYTFHSVPVPFMCSLNIPLHEYSLRRYGNIPNDFTKCMNLTTSKKSKSEKPVEVMCPCCDEPHLYNSDIFPDNNFGKKIFLLFSCFKQLPFPYCYQTDWVSMTICPGIFIPD